MSITAIIILVIVGLLFFGGFGFLYYCDITNQKKRKAEAEIEATSKNKK